MTSLTQHRIHESLTQRIHGNPLELTGFCSSSIASTFVFSEFLERAVEVAIFALITGILGAFGAHLFKLVLNKLSKKHETKTES